MTKHVTRSVQFYPTSSERFSNNGSMVEGPLFHRVATQLNHVAHYLKKGLICQPVNFQSVPDPASADRALAWAYFRTGEATSKIRAYVGLCKASNVSATDPYAFMTLTDVNAVTSTDSEEIHYPANDTSTSTVNPEDIFHGSIEMDVSANTLYELQLNLYGYARHVYWTVLEHKVGSSVDDSVTGITSPAPYANESPVYADDISELITSSNELWQHNCSHLLSYSCPHDGTNPIPSTRTANTYAQDSTQTDEFYTDVAYHRTLVDTTIPVRFAALAATSSGSTNGVRLVDADSGTQLLEITGWGTTATWRGVTGTIPATTRAVKVERKSDGAATFSLYAYSLFQWES